MNEHKQLINEADELFEGLKEEERDRLVFRWSFVGNHMSLMTYERIQALEGKLKYATIAIGIPLLLAFLKYILGL